MNVDFASYVREASFHLSLSAEMCAAILHLDTETKKENGHPCIYSRRTSNALYRRGLIVPTARAVPLAWRLSPAWPYLYDLTTAGQLVRGLLAEAGFKPDSLPFLESEEIPEPVVTLKS